MHCNNVFQYSKIRKRKRNAKKSIKTVKNWNPALFGIRNPLRWNPESKNVLDSLTWGKRIATHYCFQNEILVTKIQGTPQN